jgi:hypothetical protein
MLQVSKRGPWLPEKVRLWGLSPANDPQQQEVARLIDAALIPYHHALLMTLYATGASRAELTRLKITSNTTCPPWRSSFYPVRFA